jgi:hypothetical protein
MRWPGNFLVSIEAGAVGEFTGPGNDVHGSFVKKNRRAGQPWQTHSGQLAVAGERLAASVA